VQLLQLWFHENMRVFADRMINDEDKLVLQELMFVQAEKEFSVNKDSILDRERIIFGDYQFGNESENRPYQIVDDMSKMQKRIEDYLEDYNAGSKHPMKLVMFLDACDHVSRICRILRQPLGNALLLGVGGSGRQSLSRLATYISNYRLYQIEVIKGYSMRDWRDNVKTCLMMAGCDAKQTSFLFVDTQIINEQMLEDINNVLNSGDVPGLYKAEDLEPIYAVGKTECARKQLAVTKMNMFQCYLSRVKQNIHMVIAMSPLGEVFRTRLRNFPSLVTCCTIDWFTNWPAEALINVAKGFVADAELNLDKDESGCIEMFKIIHQSVEDKVIEFLEVFRRRSYVTPTSYLELLSSYKKVLGEQRSKNTTATNRLVRGLEVLKEAEIEIDKMEKKLKEDKPILEETQIKVAEKKKDIEEKTVIAEE
jgi:dynein heavy chain